MNANKLNHENMAAGLVTTPVPLYNCINNMTDIIIQVNDSEHLVQTSIDEPIIQTALRNGLRLIHSCLKGECGLCRAYLISGEVDMKTNSSLTEEDVKRGQILLCKAHPLSNEIIVKPIHIPREC